MTLDQQRAAPTEDAPKDRHLLTGTLFRRRSSRVTLTETPPPPKLEPVRPPPQGGPDALTRAPPAERRRPWPRGRPGRRCAQARAHVGPGDATAGPAAPAPDLQRAVLALEAVNGAEPISERALSAVAHAGSWVER
jgi:hypothetical protein